MSAIIVIGMIMSFIGAIVAPPGGRKFVSAGLIVLTLICAGYFWIITSGGALLGMLPTLAAGVVVILGTICAVAIGIAILRGIAENPVAGFMFLMVGLPTVALAGVVLFGMIYG